MTDPKRVLHFVPAVLAALLAVALPGGCSDDSPTNHEPEPDAVLSGGLDTTNLQDPAAKTGLADDVWVVAVSQAGDVDASCGLLQPLQGVMPFSLDVRTGHDYVVEFRHDHCNGPTLGVLALDGDDGPRAAFTVPAGAAQIDLGVIVLDTASGLAASSLGQDLVQSLPAPAADYPDRDGDRLPDAFDRDDDNDGIEDAEDGMPGVVSYTFSGGNLILETPLGSCEARIWMEGDFDGATGRLTLDEAAPARFVFTTHFDAEVMFPEFAVWVDSLPLVLDGRGTMLQGNLRIGSPGFVRVTAVPGTESPDEPDLMVLYCDTGEVLGQARLTCEQMRCVGDDPAGAEPFVLMAWLGVEGVRAMQETASLAVRGFDHCIQNRDRIRDARQDHGTDLVLPCFTFPGDGGCGQVAFGWQDENGNGDVTPGDSFSLTFTGCWMDYQEEMVDEMLAGTLHILRYIDTRTGSDDGVMGAQACVFDELLRQETRTEDGVTMVDDGSQVTVSSRADDGGYGGPALWITF